MLSGSRTLFLLSGALNQITRGFRCSAVAPRWYRDHAANAMIYRYGYEDRVKTTGMLPRISNDSRRIKTIKPFTPTDPFSPSLALYGQNDYIDILGHEDLHPARIHYHVPKWLRGYRCQTHFQVLLRKNEHLKDTGFQWAFPQKYNNMQMTLRRYWFKQRKHLNQKRWTNYTGIKYGPVPNPFRDKYPF